MPELSRFNANRRVRSRENGLLYDQGSHEARRKVCIVGFEESIRREAPLNNYEWEIWCLNMGNRIPGLLHDDEGKLRVDRWFDLHEEHAQDANDLAWIHSCPVPIYVTDLFTDNPMALAYPLGGIIRFVKDSYFCSSFAYMLCLAAYEGFQEIRLSGVNLNYGRELAVERANLEYWIGYFRGKGLSIQLQESSKLVRHGFRYGFEYTQEKQHVELRMASLVEQLLDYPEVMSLLQDRLKVRHADHELAMKSGG